MENDIALKTGACSPINLVLPADGKIESSEITHI